MVFNELINTYLRTGHGDAWCESAVITERGISYLRYDAIRIGNATDVSGGVSVQFLWKGVTAAWTRAYGSALKDSRYIATEAIEGRISLRG